MNDRAPISIRAAEDRDLPPLATLLSLSTGLETSATQVRARLARSRGIEHAIVATLEEQVVGFASLRLAPCLGEDGPYAEVSELFVLPQHRQHGIGAALL